MTSSDSVLSSLPEAETRRQPVANIILTAMTAAFAIPPVVFAIVALLAGMSPGETFFALVEQYREPRQNLGVIGALSVLPIVLLSLVVWLLSKFKRLQADRRALALGGALSILAVLVWVNATFWPTFLPDRTYAGFPHGLEFVMGPLFFAPGAMVLGLAVAALAARGR